MQLSKNGKNITEHGVPVQCKNKVKTTFNFSQIKYHLIQPNERIISFLTIPKSNDLDRGAIYRDNL